MYPILFQEVDQAFRVAESSALKVGQWTMLLLDFLGFWAYYYVKIVDFDPEDAGVWLDGPVQCAYNCITPEGA